ncbi:AGC/NDR protein kinase [Rhizoctonia solani AG-1 IA]|uniref:non-specific serine/threonine protein kinase n=1 Tax=Thanatephorus cucumeris (strain AG1-IA) TaxID=983506 RepID=L8X2Y3_THACA|nr:AGC/NDR protein kinase [Rhizoctonia solani AG-1 IA]
MPHIWNRGGGDSSFSTPPASPKKRGVEGLPNTDEDVHMLTAKLAIDDVHMDTARTGTRKGAGLQIWEREALNSPEVKRKAVVAQMFFLDYYFQNLGYLASRKERRAAFDAYTRGRGLSPAEYAAEFKSYCGRERVVLRRRRAKLRVDQFHIIAQVGQGGYGEVYLARKKETGEVCALKKMRKRTLHKMDEAKRDILTATKTPWLVRLLYAFQDPTFVYLAMEYVPGGDFRTLLNNSGVLKEEHARFYISEMIQAVSELHKLGYIHRDLKPENFLVDGTGHVKLTDFGLATGALNPKIVESLKHKLEEASDENVVHRSTMDRRSMYRSMRNEDARYVSIDTPAPEVLRGKPYTYSVDFWSLGCILFEFLSGFPPFSGGSSDETWANLKNWNKVLKRPEYDRPEDLIFNLSDVAWDCITRLIAGASTRPSKLSQIADHPFFEGSHWEDLRSIPAPFVPALDSEEDVGYYDDFTNSEDMAKYAEVQAKQRSVDKVAEKEEKFGRGVWVGFTFGKNGMGPKGMNAMVTGSGIAEVEEGHLDTIF